MSPIKNALHELEANNLEKVIKKKKKKKNNVGWPTARGVIKYNVFRPHMRDNFAIIQF